MSGLLSRSNFEKTKRYLKKNGVGPAFYAALERVENGIHDSYRYLAPTEAEISYQKRQNGGNTPFITIVIPTYNTPETFLREALESVFEQTYDNYELIIADASDSNCVKKVIDGLQTDEDKKKHIRYISLEENLGISGNTNAGLEAASGDYICFMDHDDLLTVDALFHMAQAMTDRPALIYSDEDKMDSDTGKFFDVYRKYDFNPDLLFTNNYVCHLTAVRRDIADKIRLRGEFDGAQDYDLILQVTEYLLQENRVPMTELDRHIVHVPRVLYHWRSHAASTAENTDSKSYAYEAGKKAVETFYRNIYGNDSRISVSHSRHLGFYRTAWGNGGTDLFSIRPEAGAIVHRIIDSRGRMARCIMNGKGEYLYAGMNRHFSGDKNLFDCAQDVGAADMRFMLLRPELNGHLRDFLEKKGYSGLKDVPIDNMKELSMEFCKELHDEGYLIIYTAD